MFSKHFFLIISVSDVKGWVMASLDASLPPAKSNRHKLLCKVRLSQHQSSAWLSIRSRFSSSQRQPLKWLLHREDGAESRDWIQLSSDSGSIKWIVCRAQRQLMTLNIDFSHPVALASFSLALFIPPRNYAPSMSRTLAFLLVCVSLAEAIIIIISLGSRAGVCFFSFRLALADSARLMPSS